MIRDAYFVSTGPGERFGPPSSVETYEQYREWLRERYQCAQGRDGNQVFCYGIAQRINEMAYAAKHGAQVTVGGPFAAAAADELRDISDGRIDAVEA